MSGISDTGMTGMGYAPERKETPHSLWKRRTSFTGHLTSAMGSGVTISWRQRVLCLGHRLALLKFLSSFDPGGHAYSRPFYYQVLPFTCSMWHNL